MMKIYSLLIASFFVISCSNPRIHIPSAYEYRYMYYGEEAASATINSIREAGKLAEEYPEETILNDEIVITLNFKRNDQYDSNAFQKLTQSAKEKHENLEKLEKERQKEFSRSLEEIMTGDYSRVKTFDESESTRLTENPIPDGEVYALSNYEYNYTTLKDFISRPFIVSYNSMTTPNNFSFKIDGNVADLKQNTEKNNGSSYFKTDARYIYFDMSLPIRGTRVNACYTEKTRDARFKSMIYIQEDHFAKEKIIRIAKPDWLEYDIVEMNFEGLDYKKEEIEMEDISVDDDFKNRYETVPSTNKNDGKNNKGKTGIEPPTETSKVKTKSRYIVYTFKNLQPYQKYKSGRGASYNLPLLYFHYKSVSMETGVKPIFKTTDDMYRWYKLITGTLQNDTSVFADFTRNLVSNCQSDMDKIRTVFYWIQDNIRYLAFEDGIAGFRPDECSNVYAKKYGDCKGMANLSRNMLKVLGFDARMVWIGTRHLNFSYSKPGLPVDNHAICAVKLGGRFLFLDATETYCSLGDYANRIQGRKCIVENGESYTIETIPEFGPEHNEELVTETIELNGDKLNVKGVARFKGESKMEFLRDYNLIRSQNKDQTLFTYLTDDRLSLNAHHIVSSDLKNRDIDAILEYELTVENHAIIKDGKTFVNLDWNRYFSNLDFDSTRKIDFSFGSKKSIKRNVVIHLKSGQKVGKLPEMVNIDNAYYSFFLEVKQVGGKLEYKRSLVTKEDYIPVSMLKKLSEDSRKLDLFYNTLIELTEGK